LQRLTRTDSGIITTADLHITLLELVLLPGSGVHATRRHLGHLLGTGRRLFLSTGSRGPLGQ